MRNDYLRSFRSLSVRPWLVWWIALMLIPYAQGWSEEDAAGDVATEPGSQSVQADWVDIRELALAEDEEALSVTLTLADRPCQTAEDRYLIEFTRGAVAYRLENMPSGQCREWRLVQSANNTVRTVARLDGQVDGEAVIIEVARSSLVDEAGVPLASGTKIASIAATARTGGNMRAGPVVSPAAVDYGPDTGVWPEFLARMGGTSHGSLFLDTPTPLRVSNGEATTFVYTARVHNLGDEELVATLEAETDVSAWDLRLPGAVRIPAQEFVRVPVVLALPFEHRHGMTEWFQIRAEAGDGSEHWATLDLGVHWVEVPQPSGHHPEVFLHSAPSGSLVQSGAGQDLWFNTLSWGEDPGATEEPAAFDLRENDVGQRATYVADVRLDPRLLLGLDFELGRPADLEVEISNDMDGDLILNAGLLYSCGSGSNCTQVQLAASEPTSVTIGPDPTSFSLPMHLNQSADVVPYVDGSNLMLRIEMVQDGGAAPVMGVGGQSTPSPRLHPDGSRMELPLREYHDPIEDVFAAVHGLELSTGKDQARRANPGDLVIWDIQARNPLPTNARVLASLHGQSAQWATVSPESQLIPGEDWRNFILQVHVPEDATENHRFAAAFIVEAQDNPNIVAVLPLSVDVVPEALHDYPSDAMPTDEPGQKSPGSGFAVILLAAAFALARRRP